LASLLLSEITLLFDLSLDLDRTLAQRKAERKAKSLNVSPGMFLTRFYAEKSMVTPRSVVDPLKLLRHRHESDEIGYDTGSIRRLAGYRLTDRQTERERETDRFSLTGEHV